MEKLSKTLAIGSVGYSQAPQNMSGAVAVTKESVDPNIKNMSWGTKDLKQFGGFKKKNKKRKKIIKAILLVKKSFPELSIVEIVNCFIDRLQYKIEKSSNPNKIDKDLLKAIIKTVKKNHPGLNMDSVVYIAEQVYSKKKH